MTLGSLHGAWRLTAHAEAPELVEGRPGHDADTARTWAGTPYLPPTAPWQEGSGTVLVIGEDGSAVEAAVDEEPMPWWDVDGVLQAVPTPFDGRVVPTERGDHLLPADEDAELDGVLRGVDTTDVGDVLVVEADLSLVRMVSVSVEGGYALHRSWYRYVRTSFRAAEALLARAATRSVPLTLDSARRIEVPASLQESLLAEDRQGLDHAARAAEERGVAPLPPEEQGVAQIQHYGLERTDEGCHLWSGSGLTHRLLDGLGTGLPLSSGRGRFVPPGEPRPGRLTEWAVEHELGPEMILGAPTNDHGIATVVSMRVGDLVHGRVRWLVLAGEDASAWKDALTDLDARPVMMQVAREVWAMDEDAFRSTFPRPPFPEEDLR